MTENISLNNKTIYPWTDQDYSLLPKSIEGRFLKQSATKRKDLASAFPFLFDDKVGARFALVRPTAHHKAGLIEMAYEHQETATLSLYNFYKIHKNKDDLPDKLPSTLIFDLTQAFENYASKNQVLGIIQQYVSANTMDKDKIVKLQNTIIKLFTKNPKKHDWTRAQFFIKCFLPLANKYKIAQPFNAEWISERFRECHRGERDIASLAPYREQFTQAYVYFDPHRSDESRESLTDIYINANEKSKQDNENARWWVILDRTIGRVVGTFRYEGDCMDIGACNHKDYRGTSTVSDAIILTGWDIYAHNPEITEVSAYHPANENSPAAMIRMGYDAITPERDAKTAKYHYAGHYYDEGRIIEKRNFDTFFLSAMHLKKTFVYLDIISQFTDSELYGYRNRLQKLGKELYQEAKIQHGEDRKPLSCLKNEENILFLEKIAAIIYKTHPEISKAVCNTVKAYRRTANQTIISALINNSRCL